MTVASERELLAAVLDALVPASGEFPAAGTVALPHVLAAAAASPEVDALLSRALEAVKSEAGAVGAPHFGSLDPDGRELVLRRVERSHPLPFEALLRKTYEGYYSHPAVLARLGLDPRPPHPRGHRVESGDLGSLARVAQRGPLYRRP
ncbi:MAG TPA: gluconate 2-dehydrogenase subunit 3 family protein [Candidatus Methylomirabilis sp.]|nr:gluconate 2-dehydrogenase subunit 3 family protein [Candidatus Methylomirabilis sp.]